MADTRAILLSGDDIRRAVSRIAQDDEHVPPRDQAIEVELEATVR